MHICPQEIMAIMMMVPVAGHVLHWAWHKMVGKRCKKDHGCKPHCTHPVVKKGYVHDPLDS